MFLLRPHPGVVTGPQSRCLARLAARHASPAPRAARPPSPAAARAFHGFGGSLKLLHDQLQAKPELQRAASSAAAAAAPPPADSATPTVPGGGGGGGEPAGKPRRRTSRLVTAALLLLAGVAAGSSFRLLVAPPAPPAPGSDEDAYTLSVLASRAARLPLVRALGADPAWASWPAYASVPGPDAPRRLTTGPLAGSRGVGGFQRVFRNAATGEVVVVAYLGAATGGWPGVVHGGLAATLLDEACGRCAAGVLDAGTGVTARLELNYRAPTLTNGFYVLRAAPEGGGEAAAGRAASAPAGKRKVWVDARLETTEGKLCVEARGLFVAPRGLELGRIDEGF